MNIKSGVTLADFSTMQVGGKADKFVRVTSIEELQEAIEHARSNELDFAVIGEGSNIMFEDAGYRGLIIKNEITGFSIKQVNGSSQKLVTIGAGENWDDVVEKCVDQGLTGIEALSYIPGSAGAAPVQNIGAYGQEISETLDSVTVFDTENFALTTLTNQECRFKYRDSRFKQNKNEIIVSFSLVLQPGEIEGELYEALSDYLRAEKISSRQPSVIRKALYEIRWGKLPKPSEIPNCGSYFHNVVVDKDTFAELINEFPNMKHYPAGSNYKIPTGWLLEELGLKGFCHANGVCTYDKQALIIVNPKHKGYANILQFENMIRKMVRDHFGLELTREPQLIH